MGIKFCCCERSGRAGGWSARFIRPASVELLGIRAQAGSHPAGFQGMRFGGTGQLLAEFAPNFVLADPLVLPIPGERFTIHDDGGNVPCLGPTQYRFQRGQVCFQVGVLQV